MLRHYVGLESRFLRVCADYFQRNLRILRESGLTSSYSVSHAEQMDQRNLRRLRVQPIPKAIKQYPNLIARKAHSVAVIIKLFDLPYLRRLPMFIHPCMDSYF